MTNLGYTVGLRGAQEQRERPGATGGEKFASAQGGKRQAEQRMAGSALNLDLTKSPGLPPAFSLPSIGFAELRTPEIPQ